MLGALTGVVVGAAWWFLRDTQTFKDYTRDLRDLNIELELDRIRVRDAD